MSVRMMIALIMDFTSMYLSDVYGTTVTIVEMVGRWCTIKFLHSHCRYCWPVIHGLTNLLLLEKIMRRKRSWVHGTTCIGCQESQPLLYFSGRRSTNLHQHLSSCLKGGLNPKQPFGRAHVALEMYKTTRAFAIPKPTLRKYIIVYTFGALV